MDCIENPYRGAGLTTDALGPFPWPEADARATTALLQRCPRHGQTPLVDAGALAARAGIARLDLKDERARMGLGSFKALGAANVIAHDAERGQAAGKTYVTASAGNHGLSVAAGAAAFGATARIFIAETVPESFADRLRAEGAEVVRRGATYEGSMSAARDAAADGDAVLLSDSSWPGYAEAPHLLMEGYTVLMAEAVDQIADMPTHIFLQAGVGGLAAAAAAHARAVWGDGPQIVVVEPELAPALIGSIRAGEPVAATGAISIMGRLDCKEPSYIALKGLARDADWFVTISEEDARRATEMLAELGLPTTPSGAAGVAGIFAARTALGLGEGTRALAILSEAA